MILDFQNLDDNVDSIFQFDTTEYNYEIIYKSKIKIKRPELLKKKTIPPDFTLKTIDKDTISLHELRGKVVIIDFWYMACHPCIKALPHLQSLYEKYEKDGLIVIGINPFDSGRIEKLPEFLKFNNVQYPVLISDRELPKIYNVSGYPTIYILNKKGEIVYSELGYDEGDELEWEKIIKKLL